MGNIQRLKDNEISGGNIIFAANHDAELDQLINESNSKETRIVALESGAMTISGNKTLSGDNTHSGNNSFTGTVKVPVSAGFAPASNGEIGYDSTSHTYDVYVDGSAQYLIHDGNIPAASDTAAGVIEVAVQAEMETATSTTLAVTPGRQQYHPSAAKMWVNLNGTSTIAINKSYNVSSLTDNGTGDYRANLTVAFSDANYAAVATSSANQTDLDGTYIAGAVGCRTQNSSGTLTDATRVCIVAFGDQ